MHINFSAVAGITGGIICLCASIPYILDIFRHETKPERAMWWIYSFLFVLLFAAQASARSGWVLVVTAEYILSSLLTAILSLKYGFGSFHKRDYVSIAIAAAGILIWWLTGSPLLAIIMIIIVDFAGFWLTLLKTWYAPHSETLISWEISLVGSVLSIFATGRFSLTVTIYPVYAALTITLLVWEIRYRRSKIKTDAKDV